MTQIQVIRFIKAPVETVFGVFSDVTVLAKAVPHMKKVEFLTEQKSGLGTRFRETRLMGSREMQTELEITEFVRDDRIRMIADSHGTVWDTIFQVAADEDGTKLTTTMCARAHKILPRLMNPFMKRLFKKGVEKDMDLVKEFCESDQG